MFNCGEPIHYIIIDLTFYSVLRILLTENNGFIFRSLKRDGGLSNAVQ